MSFPAILMLPALDERYPVSIFIVVLLPAPLGPRNPTISPASTEKLKEYLAGYNRLMAYYKCAMMEVETKLNVLNEQFSLRYDRNPISSIKTRLKSPESIKNKLEGRTLPITLESIEKNLHDVAGIRVVCTFPQDVYTIKKALLSQDDITLIEEKDYIRNPKTNGYRSLHLIISVPIYLLHEKRTMQVEIQLRTIAMDSWAELEHQLKYKKDVVFTEEMSQNLLLCAQMSAELDARMDFLRDCVGEKGDI